MNQSTNLLSSTIYSCLQNLSNRLLIPSSSLNPSPIFSPIFIPSQSITQTSSFYNFPIQSAMGDERGEAFLRKGNALSRSVSLATDELHSFRSWFRWLCMDQSNAWTTCLSWFVFLLFTIVIPCLSHFYLACTDCDSKHSRPFDSLVQFSLSSVATLSFLCLSHFLKKYGLRRFLFFDKLCDESETVRKCYTQQLNVTLSL